MRQQYVKKYWAENDILFYLHFKDGEAIRQIEFTPKGKIFLTLEEPQKGDSMLYDQTLDELDLQESDFITEEEFNKVWSDQ